MVQLFYIFIFSHSHTPFIVVVISVLYIFTFSSRARWALRSTATKCVRGGLQRATKRLNWLLEAVNRWLDAYSPIERHQMCLVPPLCIAVILIHYIASPGTSCVALTWYWRQTVGYRATREESREIGFGLTRRRRRALTSKQCDWRTLKSTGTSCTTTGVNWSSCFAIDRSIGCLRTVVVLWVWVVGCSAMVSP